MKLKRCPNLHYYDGDKYDRCPHCAAQKAEPAPAPKPVMEPVPAEPPKPVEPPKPAEQPKPVEQPKPIEPPLPVSVAQAPAEDTWRCGCGAVNSGKFCPQCGSPRPAAAPVEEPKPVVEEPKPVVEEPKPVIEEPKPIVEEPASVAEEPQPVFVPEDDTKTAPAGEVRKIYYQDVVEDAPAPNEDEDDNKTRVLFDEMEDDYVLGWLAVTNTSSKGRIFTITSSKTTIGRADAPHPVDIDLRNDRGISRGAQATFVYDPLNKQFFLQNAGGKTFVYVNREIVLTYTRLKPYDIIRIGDTELVFVPLCSDAFSW